MMQEYDDFLSKLSPLELDYAKAEIINLLGISKDLGTSNRRNLEETVDHCPHCGALHIVCNGHDKKKNQKYVCRECGKSFAATTRTMFFHSHISYEEWKTFIELELAGNALRFEASCIDRSVTTCFSMRHKLHEAIGKIVRQKLSGSTEVDFTYENICLKGMRPEDMPRESKKRGRHIPDPANPELRGLSHHKVCIATAIDENDHMLYEIAGLGIETQDKLEMYADRFSDDCVIISDHSQAIINFAANHRLPSDVIKVNSDPAKHNFTTPTGNSLSSVNQMHTELSNLIRRTHGVSIRHLQGYLDFICFVKQIRYQVDVKMRTVEGYCRSMTGAVRHICREICKLPIPIDLREAYAEL